MLLADVLDKICIVCLYTYKLDSAYYLTTPCLVSDVVLKLTGEEFQPLTDCKYVLITFVPNLPPKMLKGNVLVQGYSITFKEDANRITCSRMCIGPGTHLGERLALNDPGPDEAAREHNVIWYRNHPKTNDRYIGNKILQDQSFETVGI